MIRTAFSLTISRSTRLLIYLLFAHGLMLITMLNLLQGYWWLLSVSLAIIVSFIHCYQKYQLLSGDKFMTKIERDTNDDCSVFYGDDSKNSALKLSSSVVTPNLVILYFKGAHFWQSTTAFLVADAVDPDLFRELRVYCRDPKIFQQQ